MENEYLKITKEEYKQALKDGVYEVIFEKKDGSLRRMVATLSSAFIPKTPVELMEEKMAKPKRKENATVVCVYDIELGAWRSFTADRVISFKKKTVEKV